MKTVILSWLYRMMELRGFRKTGLKENNFCQRVDQMMYLSFRALVPL